MCASFAPVAAFGQVGVLGWKEFEGLAGVVAEDLLLVGFGAVVAAAHGEAKENVGGEAVLASRGVRR